MSARKPGRWEIRASIYRNGRLVDFVSSNEHIGGKDAFAAASWWLECGIAESEGADIAALDPEGDDA